MKVYHLEANGRTNTGEYVLRITKALDTLMDKGVEVFTSENSFHSDALNVFSSYATSNKYQKLFYYFQGWKRLKTHLQRENGECILHVHWLRFSPIDYLFLKRLKKQKNIRLVFTVHNILPHETMPFDRFFYRKIYALFDNLIFHSQQNIHDFKISFANNTVEKDIVPHYSYEVVPNIPQNNKLIKLLFFGAIRPYKGLELLIAALKQMDSAQQWEVTIAGKPEYDISSVRAKVDEDAILKERVKWITGWIEDKEIPDLFQQSHIVVLPYLKIDNSGLVHLAMSYGKTIVVPDIGVFRDLITDKKDGFFFQGNDADSLSEKLSEIIDSDHFESVGEGAMKKMKKHSIENIATSLMNIYNNRT